MRRRTLISILVFFVLSAFLYFYEIKGEKERKLKEEREKTLFLVKKDEIEEINFLSKGEILCKKEKGKWIIKKPILTDADQIVINDILEDLTKVKWSEKILVNEKDFKRFGLENPKIKVTFSTKEKKFSLSLGDETPSYEYIYARKDKENIVYLVSSSLKYDLSKTLFDLRDKKVISFNPDLVKSFELEKKKEKIKLTKVDEEWKITYPKNTLADFSEVNSFLYKLSNLKAIKIIDYPKSKDYGFKKPKIKIKIFEKEGKKEVIIGKKEKNSYYLKSSSKKPIFVIASSDFSSLNKTLFDFRKKDLFDFKEVELKEIYLIYPEKTLKFLKTSEDKWIMEKSKDFDEKKFRDYLFDLEFLQAKEFIDNYNEKDLISFGLKKPKLLIKVIKKDSSEDLLFIGNKTKDEKYFYAWKGNKSPIVKISSKDAEKLLKKRFLKE